MYNYIKEKMQSVVTIIIMMILVITFCFALSSGIKKKEINECNNWIKMAEKYEDFYLTKYEAEQCMFLNIEVNAPIK